MLSSLSGCFIPGKEPITIQQGLGGPQIRSGRFGADESLLLLPGFEPLTVQPV